MITRLRRALAAAPFSCLPLLLTACAATGPEPDLAITLRPIAADAIGVEVAFAGDDDGVTRLSVLESWGGNAPESAWFGDLEAIGGSGEPLDVARAGPHAVDVAHAPGERVELAYELSGLPTGYADVDDYRPIRSEGAAALFLPISVYLPEHLVPRKEDLRGARPPDVRLRFAWEGLGDAVGGPWSAFGSFGEGAGPIDGLYAPSRVRQSFVSAGRLGHARRRVPGGEFAAVRIGEGGAFTPEQLAGLVEPIVRGTRAFFAGADGGLSDPWYMVSFAPAGEPVENGFALGGTAVTNAFAFYFDPSVDLVAYPPLFEVVAHVLCHEYFHNWNGVLFFVGEPNYEHESRWIVEGFTDFFTRRILLRSGVYGLDSFAEAVNTRIDEYTANPRRGVGNREAADAWDTDPRLSDMLYQRGELLAMLIDEEVRARSGGDRSLDDLMLDLTRRARGGEPAADPEWVLAWIAERSSDEFADQIRRLVEKGGPVPLPDRLSEAGLVLQRGEDGRARYVSPG